MEDRQILTQPCRQLEEPWVQLQLLSAPLTVAPGYSTVWGCCELAGHLIALSPGMGWAELWMAQPRWFVHCNKYSSERVTFLISNGFISPPKLTTPLCVTVSFADEETDSEKGGVAYRSYHPLVLEFGALRTSS